MCARNTSIEITVWHHSASLVMPNSDPRDGFFCLPLIPVIDSFTNKRFKILIRLCRIAGGFGSSMFAYFPKAFYHGLTQM